MSLADINPGLPRGPMVSVAASTTPEACDSGVVASVGHADDLSRDVYCVLGLPIDAVDMTGVTRKIESAAAGRAPFLISTPNLNFLVNSRSDPEFRESLLDSDLCPADGMPIVWIARLLGLPIKKRVSGSDIFDALNRRPHGVSQLKVFLFGGAAGVAAMAAKTLNAASAGLNCVGSFDPGFGTVEELSHHEVVATLNASGADFLAVSLGAAKGQKWLHRNHGYLTVPVRAHLGATINFHAGNITRAPPSVRALGLEWLWRIKEEPHLWRRYWKDGCVLLHLLLARILPLAIEARWHRLKSGQQGLQIRTSGSRETLVISLHGAATEPHIRDAIACFREALTSKTKCIIVDLSGTRTIDPRFLGLLLMFQKQLKKQNTALKFIRASRQIERAFRLNDLAFLFDQDHKTQWQVPPRCEEQLHTTVAVSSTLSVPRTIFDLSPPSL